MYKVVKASCELETDCKLIVDAKGCTSALSDFGVKIINFDKVGIEFQHKLIYIYEKTKSIV